MTPKSRPFKGGFFMLLPKVKGDMTEIMKLLPLFKR